MQKKHIYAAAALGLAIATAALAQDHNEMPGMPGMGANGDLGPAANAFALINDQMHAAMMIEFTGDPDVDFVLSMIPHHQGAVEMAKVVLEYGSDPEIRALAQGIVEAQEAEIGFMEAWLTARR